MSNISEKVLETSQDKGLRYMNVSRRTFLKGALAVGGALALAGCTRDPIDPTTAPATTAPPTTAPATTAPPASGSTSFDPYGKGVKIEVPTLIIPDYVECVGCHTCMVMCSLFHYGVNSPYLSNIQVYSLDIKGGMVDVPILCVKCSDAPCQAVCPPAVSAISRDELTGAMILDHDKCIGCNLCVEACAEDRTGCLRLAYDGTTVYGMCDMCGGDPECLRYCPEDCLKITQGGGGLTHAGEYWARKPEYVAERVWQILYGTE